MKLPHRRHVLHLAAGAAALPAVSRIAWATRLYASHLPNGRPCPVGSGAISNGRHGRFL